MSEKIFTVKEEHIKLLKRAYVRWEDCEFGAPAIDCKRPYGNSDAVSDIADILGVEGAGGESDFSPSQEDALIQFHKETETALQIFLATGEMKAGKYAAFGYNEQWKFLG